MPQRTDISSVLIIGAGRIVFGQACEFDYPGTRACKALRAIGYRVILVSSDPATIMTDPELADSTYVAPVTPGVVEQIITAEGPFARLSTIGGRSARNGTMMLADYGGAGSIRHGIDRRQSASNRDCGRPGPGPRHGGPECPHS